VDKLWYWFLLLLLVLLNSIVYGTLVLALILLFGETFS